MSKTDKSLSSQSWQASVRIVEDFLKTDRKLDVLLEEHTRGLAADVVPRVQFLSYGVVKNLGRLLSLLREGTRKLPKKRLQSILLVSLFEWLEAEESVRPKVVHFSVERAKHSLSKPESRFVNAFLRKAPELIETEPREIVAVEELSRMYSHPEWLVKHWIDLWGFQNTQSFLKWNQNTPKVYAYSLVSDSRVPEDWRSTEWPGFFEIQDADWRITRTFLAEGKAYVQDPSTRLGAEFLVGHSIKSVLDLCAAPGGKSIQLLQRMADSQGLLVSVDVPGDRFERLKENLKRYSRSGTTAIQVSEDVLRLTSSTLPQAEYDAVYLDVPCSNTGVLQRRSDVKWRQTEQTIQELERLQMALLEKAAEFVRKDGFLIYSTCSVDPKENEELIQRFLKNIHGCFRKERELLSYPWESGHDGAGVFLLRRV